VEEGIALMRQCWRGQPFDFEGRFHSAERLHVRPRPVQQPHPPLFMATNSEDSVRSAGRLCLPTLSAFYVPVADLQSRRKIYREEARAAGHSEADIDEAERQSWGMRVVHVARSREEALRVTEAPFTRWQARLSILSRTTWRRAGRCSGRRPTCATGCSSSARPPATSGCCW
jgi:alkanesulfonate monooxygenase SsuD/methylene tetrahydromethanopterin reductase-like flavin-dependent oxidoreductase (luciferase family)